MMHRCSLMRRWLVCISMLLPLLTAASRVPAATPTPTAPPTLSLSPVPVAAATPTAPKPAAKSDAELVRESPLILAAMYGEKPRFGGKFLSVIVENLPHHDIHQGIGSNVQAQMPLYSGLLATSPYDHRQIIPDLAKSWEVTEAGKKVIFYLHEGVKWHDGMPFSSADVKYTFDRIMFQPGGNFRRTAWLAVIESVEAPDPHTVVINGKGPSPLLLQIFTDGYASIIPKHISEKDPLNALKEAKLPIGTGPFRLMEPPTTTLWRYERNPEYFKKGLPYLDAIDVHVILDIQARATAVLTQKIYWSDPTPLPQMPLSLAQSIAKQNPNIIHEGFPTLLYNHFTMNTTRPPFDDLRVRQAVSEAIDRKAFTVEGLGNQRGAMGTALWPGGGWAMPQEMREQLIGYGPDMNKRIAHAKELLASYEAEKGKIDWSRIPYLCFTQHISCENAQIIQALLKKIGVNLVLDPKETVTGFSAIAIKGDYYMGGFIGAQDFDDPIDAFTRHYTQGAFQQFHRKTIPDLDRLFELQKFETDPEKRKKLAWEMDALAMNDAGMLIVIWPLTEHLRWNFVKGWTPTPSIRNTNARMEYVWLDLPQLPHSR